jgi:hypothetical protein
MYIDLKMLCLRTTSFIINTAGTGDRLLVIVATYTETDCLRLYRRNIILVGLGFS